MDAVQWQQGIGLVKQKEEVAQSSCTNKQMLEKKPRPQEQLNCPRCNSSNTKFCYYNNYSLSQPRYFCKSCRRYWTEGGTLRNVPVGGGSRKNRRSSFSSSSSASPKVPDLNPPSLYQFSSQNHGGQDLNLAYHVPQDYDHHNASKSLQAPKDERVDNNHNNNLAYYSSSSIPSTLPALELLGSGNESRGFNSFVANPISADSTTMYSSMFPLQESKPNLSFSIDGGLGNLHGTQVNGGRHLFPFGEQKNATDEVNENKGEGNSTHCWNGIFSGRSW